MRRTVLCFAAAMLAIAASGPSRAAASASSVALSEAVAATEISAQTRRRATRLRVTPGRLLYRDCAFRLVQEFRPSGPVVVPRMRCWWVRG
jgi:hypothetical protein